MSDPPQNDSASSSINNWRNSKANLLRQSKYGVSYDLSYRSNYK